jgi:putative phage-type endonuclease
MFQVHPQVLKLNATPQVVQRTQEWFTSRKMRVTASEICSVLGVNPYKSRNVYWKEKLSVVRNEPEKERKTSWISEWGVRYEPVVQKIVRQNFRQKYNIPWDDPNEVLFEYGMVKHPTLSFLGASPDGILADGTMIEIKCPPTRVIEKDEVVPYYYSQMQLQMECCELDVVDFIECKFYEYQTYSSFITDSMPGGCIFQSIEGKPKGVVLYKDSTYHYFDPDLSTLDKWCESFGFSSPEDCQSANCTLYLYKIEVFSSKIIRRNHEYIRNMLAETSTFWESLMASVDSPDLHSCPLPSPKSFLFQNFVADNLLVINKRKKEVSASDALENDPTRLGKPSFSFKFPS